MNLDQVIEAVGKGVDAVGILIIVVGAVVASVRYVMGARGSWASEAYSLYRRNLGQAILLGLEFLVAGDIIRAVAISPTFGELNPSETRSQRGIRPRSSR